VEIRHAVQRVSAITRQSEGSMNQIDEFMSIYFQELGKQKLGGELVAGTHTEPVLRL